MDNIVLIGMPGAGKSTVGVVLAKRLGYRFIDSDLVIQEQQGKILEELIKEHGVEGFWEIEDSVNASMKLTKTVLATGGSAVYGKKAMRHLKRIALFVYLQLPCEEIAERVGDLDARGVTVRPGQTLQDLYAERIPLYEKYADVTIACEGKTLREIVMEVADRVAEKSEEKATKNSLMKKAKGLEKKPEKAQAGKPAKEPASKPTRKLASEPTRKPANEPTRKPANEPASKPTRKPAKESTKESEAVEEPVKASRRKALKDKDIREPLFSYLEETFGKSRIIEEKTMGKSRADIVMVLPGEIYGIEIKSDADTYARLERQIKDYDRYFDSNIVVVGTTHGEHIKEHVPEHWGIITVEMVEGAFDFYFMRWPLPNPGVKWKKKLELLWRPELAQIQEWNDMPKYKSLGKTKVTEKILELVPDKISELTLRRQISDILFERDYSKVKETLAEYRKSELDKQLEKETDPEKRQALMERKQKAVEAARKLAGGTGRRRRRRRR